MFNKIINNPSRFILILSALLINTIWAISYPLSKILLNSNHLSPMSLSSYRLLISGIVLIFFVKKRDLPSKISLKDFLLLLSMGGIGLVSAFILQYIGTELTTASNISLLISLEPLFIIIFAVILFNEPISKMTLFCLFLALFGSIMLSLDPKTLSLMSSKYLVGNGFMILSVMSYSIYTIASKPLIKNWGATALTAIPFLLASLILIPYVLLFHQEDFMQSLNLSLSEWLLVIFMSVIGTALSYLTWNWLMKWLSPTEISYTLFFQPIIGGIASYFILNEAMTRTFFIGGGCICFAIILGEVQKKQVKK